MKYFITGGTGFIGSHFIDYLLNNKNKVEIYALVRNPSNLKWLSGLNIHFLKGDLFSIPSLPSNIDYVFHLAGVTKSIKTVDYYTVNQLGTASLFQSLHSQRVFPRKTVLLSSLAASGPSSEEKPVKEKDPPHPVTPYGKSKLEGEKEALKYKQEFPLVILRPGPIFGPRDKDFLPYFKWVNRGILLSLNSFPRRLSMCYVRDLIHALNLSTEKKSGSGEIFHIADPHPYTYDEIGEAAGAFLGKKLKKFKISISFAYPFIQISDLVNKFTRNPSIINKYKLIEMKQKGWVADTQKAQKKLSFSPQYSLYQGIKETIHWYQKNNWL